MTLDFYLSEESTVEPFLIELFSKDDPLTIFDIGSCECEDSIRYARLFPNATIHAFEPLPDNVERAKANLEKYGITNVELSQCGLWSSLSVEGKPFYISSGKQDEEWNYGNKSSSLLPPKRHTDFYDYVLFKKKTTIATDTIGFYCYRNSLKVIDFMHIDIQGGELDALIGAAEMMKHIKLIWMEVSRVELYANQPLYQDVVPFMQGNGFKLLLDEVGDISGNQLWINQDFYK